MKKALLNREGLFLFLIVISTTQTKTDYYNMIKLKSLDVITLTKIPVIFEGKDFILLHQYASGYCEITEEGSPQWYKTCSFFRTNF
jgi:hypothetical protein